MQQINSNNPYNRCFIIWIHYKDWFIFTKFDFSVNYIWIGGFRSINLYFLSIHFESNFLSEKNKSALTSSLLIVRITVTQCGTRKNLTRVSTLGDFLHFYTTGPLFRANRAGGAYERSVYVARIWCHIRFWPGWGRNLRERMKFMNIVVVKGEEGCGGEGVKWFPRDFDSKWNRLIRGIRFDEIQSHGM